jgi:PBP1b-binding outer membrane lipoprotein LpoB
MKTRISLIIFVALLTGCATDPSVAAGKAPSGLPAPEKITSDINMTRAFPKSVESGN